MLPESQRLSSEERDHLVAFLDGELPEALRDRITAQLGRSVTARREVETLERAWDYLDFLPRPQTLDHLLTRTLDEVGRLDSPQQVWDETARSWGRCIAETVALATTVATITAMGFVGARWLWPDRTRQLERDISLARHLDEYRAVDGNVEFLKQLDKLPEFQGVSR